MVDRFHLGLRDELLHEGLDDLGLGQRRDDPFVLDQRHRHVAGHRDPVAAGAAEVVSGGTVSHGSVFLRVVAVGSRRASV